nr:class I SAM-dependent methyltransferase [Candidatus Sigynarchaeota archaeon]
MFDTVDVYVRTIDWDARLARELPHVEALIQEHEASNTRPARVLDIGCGPGFHLVELAKRHPSAAFTGIDIDNAMIMHASELAGREQV